ncbi:hypothetical protein FKL15_26875, partial [Klebsiella pneumoniae]|nr:hypothetical protein [Klebsiella pneumoniae]
MCQPDASECYTPSKQASDKPGCHVSPDPRPLINQLGTVAKLAMRQPFVLFKGLTFQKLCL